MNTSVLFDGGIDYAAGVKRFVGDSTLYEEVLTDYLNDDTFSQLETAFLNEDYHSMFASVHNLKGLAGMLDMVELKNSSHILTELLRNNVTPNKEKVNDAFEKVKSAQIKSTTSIKNAIK